MRTESGEYIDTGTYVRQHYNVPAEIDGRVVANGKPGSIVGFDGAHVLILLDGEERANPWHPTWEMVYETVTPAGQAEEGLVSVRLLRNACRIWAQYMNEDDSGAVTTTERSALRAVLSAVAPDISRTERQRIVSYLREFKSHPEVLKIADAIAAQDADKPDGPEPSAKGNWLEEEFARAEERWSQLPDWARPVITRPAAGNPDATDER